MKGGQNLREVQDKKKAQAEEAWIHPPVCMICGRSCEGYHGRWGNSGTCDSACEKVQASKYPYPGHSEEEFFNRLNGEHHVPVVLSGEAGRTEDQCA